MAVAARSGLSARGVLPYCGASVPLVSHYCLRYVLFFSAQTHCLREGAAVPLGTPVGVKGTVSSAAVDPTLASEGHKPVVGIQSLRLATTSNTAVYAMSEAILLVATGGAHRWAEVAARFNRKQEKRET